MEKERSGSLLAKALDILQRRFWVAVIPFLIALGATVTIVTALPDVYQSHATVVIETQQIPTELVRSTVTSALETRLQIISQQVLSRDGLEGLIERFNLYLKLRGKVPLQSIVDKMRKDVSVRFSGTRSDSRDSTVAFTISYRGDEPETVAAVTNALATFYVEQNVKVRERQASGTSEFLKTQLVEMQKELEDMERQVSDFKAAHFGELPHQQEANLSALEQLNVQLQINADNRIRASQRLAQLEDQLAKAEERSAGDTVHTPSERLAELRLQLGNLRKQYSEKYPDVVRVTAEIAALEEQLRTKGDEPSVEGDDKAAQLRRAAYDVQVELQTLQAEAERLNEQISGYQQRVARAPLREQQFQVLMRDYETTTALYRDLLSRQKQADAAEDMERRQRGEQFRIIEPALASQVPAAPNRMRLLGTGIMFSLVVAVGLVGLVEHLDTSFHNLDDLRERIEVPVLATIPAIVTSEDRRKERWRSALTVALALIAFVLVVGFSFFVARDNASVVSLLTR